ncbi:sensor histidine kinase [Paenibacillus sp. CGMCC 1.16610]|uniref:HAMP domain-containing protein n=1 Tax=Paenibacillus anseongense TaxID=2682845 RepID=A0ABW9U123_9BACL|nr:MULTISPECIES: sensor histidine kinase [Paenibacillus]MBA2943291.1 sensor histidine kinase [Paenibacillus sp. CGMCC 1.16610]MVQ33789.1 HAMP domain-containing protein [Paenibacillus anseongense]
MRWMESLRKRLETLFPRIRTMLLLSYFVIILFCIALIGTASFYISYNSMAERVETASSQIVRQIEFNMDNDFHNKRNLLLAPYYTQEYIDNINAYPTMDSQNKFLFRQKLGDLFLKSFNITPIPDFIRFQIYYSDGELLNSSDNTSFGSPSQVLNAEWFKQTIAKDGLVNFFASPPVSGQEESPTAYSTSMLIRDFSNPTGFIVVRADYNYGLFKGIGQRADLTKNSRFLILNEINNPIYDSAEGHAADMDPEALSQIKGDSGKFWTGNGDQTMLVSYTRSQYSNWKTVLIMPKEEIFSPLDSIKTTAIWTALAAFLVTAILSLLFGRSITNPILDLYKTVNHIKRGDFSVRVDIKRKDEIGRIAMNFNAMQDELQKQIETKYVYQIKLQQVELAMLYSQINPHFLYNTLDSIKAMADYHHVEEIGQMSQSLADMFRYNTKNTDEIVTLQEELVQIDAYINIQSIRFEGKIDYQLEIEDDLYHFPMLKMTLQPLVENAVFHGIERKRGKGTIRLKAWREAEWVYIQVKDDGVGISEKRLEQILASLRQPLYQEEYKLSAASGGIGVQNVYARYTIRYGEQFQFQIESRKGIGTEVTLKLLQQLG